ncbi:hypothetical protein [Pelomonas sp. SE-A7]|uniref:hypothetical protein n=1 Tax=Pelomonas sp. SE-A7 TaxID=3054953 RepID=UPI00259CDB51|nr:hypothetical protein [Pelomonas sp. SE-A7]MDM4766873.1 hypothetical protein [Pelomonas sp. SE-A7]
MKYTIPLLALSAALLAGCAGVVKPASTLLPQDLLDATEPLPLGKLGGWRKGELQIDGRLLRYERSASRLDLFDVYAKDKSALRYTLGEGESRCSLSRHEIKLLGVTATKPMQIRCELSPQASLTLTDPPAPRMEPMPMGELALQDGRKFQVLAVYRLSGTMMPLSTPSGYLLAQDGKPQAAIDTTAGRLHLPKADTALREASLRAGLSLALLWMPD